MIPSEIEPAIPESSGSSVLSRTEETVFANLRGVRWRVNLGVLPSWTSSIDEFRRATANSRRRYALLRKRLLMDPNILKDENNSPQFFIDNPLSQSPHSTWGQFFHNVELEKTLDQDLSRLYPEHWCYFQAPGCQGMLRRILLLWCLKHPEYGYRQGMHELLVPLLYVLHVDIKSLSEVRKNYEDYFTDRFDHLSFEERDITYIFDFSKFRDSMDDDDIGSKGYSKKTKSLEELDPEVQSIVMLCDSYGAESELGIVLSEKFMEHDAYCMFDALMSGIHGSDAMARFFGYSPAKGSHTGLPPVLEACTAFYRLLAVVDSSLHSHLVELGVEPQYFGLRWLRVLFGREFSLQDLLVVWDEIFSADNSARDDKRGHNYRIFDCPRGTLILGMAVSMILYLRSSLLSTENATCCLQRLLNFPVNIDVRKIIQKAKSLQALVLDADVRSALSINGVTDQSSSVPARTKSVPCGSTLPKSPLIITPESYWEEKWRVLQRAEEEEKRIDLEKQSHTQNINRWLKVTKFFRSFTDLSRYKIGNRKREENSSQQLNPDTEEDNARNNLIDVAMNSEDSPPQENEEETMDCNSADEESIISGNEHSEESLSVSSDLTSLVRDSIYHETCSDNSTGSNLFPDENDRSVDTAIEENSTYTGNDSDSNLLLEGNYKEQQTSVDSPLSVSSEQPITESNEDDSTGKFVGITKVHKLLPVIVEWFRKLGRNNISSEEAPDATKTSDNESSKNQVVCYSSDSHLQALSSGRNEDLKNQNLMKTLQNVGKSMLKQIQLIEYVFKQEPGQVPAGLIENLTKTNLFENGQVTATKALKELRSISNLLSEM